MDDEEARTIGRRIRQVRKAREKSLRVLAGLAAMNKDDPVADREQVTCPDPLGARGAGRCAADSAERADPSCRYPHRATGVPTALSACVDGGQPPPARRTGGTVEALRARVNAILVAGRQCDQAEVGSTLPVLIRDVHTSLVAGRDVAELRDLAVLLHVQSVSHWLREVGAPIDLRRENDITLAYQLVEDRDTPIALGLAAYGATRVMLSTGAFDLAQAELDAVHVPTSNPEPMQLAGMLAMCRSLVATADKSVRRRARGLR